MKVGRQLSEARERQNLTLADISRTTKIPVHLLDAIERNDSRSSPSRLFHTSVRACVREGSRRRRRSLLATADLGEIEEVAVEAPAATMPIQELILVEIVVFRARVHGGVHDVLFRLCIAVRVSAGARLPASCRRERNRSRRARCVCAAPCAPAAPVDTPVRSVRRPARRCAVSKRSASPVQPIPVTHVVPRNEVETSAVSADSSPAVSDAIVPTPDPDSVSGAHRAVLRVQSAFGCRRVDCLGSEFDDSELARPCAWKGSSPRA